MFSYHQLFVLALGNPLEEISHRFILPHSTETELRNRGAGSCGAGCKARSGNPLPDVGRLEKVADRIERPDLKPSPSARPGLAFQIWSSSNSKFRKY